MSVLPGHQLPSPDVPIFNCIVYISVNPNGGVRARVANLSDLECTASTEREALGKIVPAFKQRISELLQNHVPIAWIDPPSPIQSGEQQRFIGVHL
jgi:hypothetical protein